VSPQSSWLCEVLGQRAELSCRLDSMITDSTGMTGMMFGEQPGRGIDLGNAVKNASQELVRIIEG
jgi:hypothetical protein